MWPRRRRERARHRRGQRGFTLIEALLALGVLAATIALVNRTFAAGWNAVRHGALESRAVAVAKAHIASAGVGAPLTEGTTSGVEDGVRWKREVTAYSYPGQTVAVPRLGGWWVRVEVAWRDTPLAAERVIVLTTMKLAATAP